MLRFWPEYRGGGRADLAASFIRWGWWGTLAGSLVTALGLWRPVSSSGSERVALAAYYGAIGLLVAAIALSEFGASALRADGRTVLALAPRDIIWRIALLLSMMLLGMANVRLDAVDRPLSRRRAADRDCRRPILLVAPHGQGRQCIRRTGSASAEMASGFMADVGRGNALRHGAAVRRCRGRTFPHARTIGLLFCRAAHGEPPRSDPDRRQHGGSTPHLLAIIMGQPRRAREALPNPVALHHSAHTLGLLFFLSPAAGCLQSSMRASPMPITSSSSWPLLMLSPRSAGQPRFFCR